tara:strand:- start:224 stop:964 length:741 start_codon:yes stop_codon:yes gene_type:complete
MGLFYYVIDTGITTGGVAVGQSTYDRLLNEKFNHGVIPLGDGIIGGGNTFAYTPVNGGTQIGIHTTKNVGIAGTALADFHLKVHGDIDANSVQVGFASVGVATVGVATFGGTYQSVKPHNKILMPANNDVALNEIGSNGYITIDVSKETVAIGTIGTMPRYLFTNVSLETCRVSTVSVIGIGSGPGSSSVSAGTTYTINGGDVKYLTWVHGTNSTYNNSQYNIMTFRILQDAVGVTSVFSVKEGNS